jgi:transposase
MGCSPATAHRRLTDWQRAGVFERLHPAASPGFTTSAGLRTRYERRAELHLAFMQLGCAVICQRALPSG